MIEINRHNYEEFFLDYLEDNLNALQLIELEKFLDANPDLKMELEEMKMPVFESDEQRMDTDSLKDIPFKSNFDDFCIARLEGDLSEENAFAFDEFVNKNEEYKQDNELYKKSILIPNKEIVFIDKESLKKDKKKIAFLWYLSRVGVAASIILLFSLWNIFDTSDDVTNGSITKVEPKEEQVERKIEPKIESQNPVEEIETPPKKIVKEEIISPTKAQNLAGNIQEKVESTIEEVVEKQLIDIPEINTKSELLAVTNAPIEIDNLEETKTDVQKVLEQNTGLAELGMSWKSSVSDKKGKSSVLYAIAKYGVDKIGEIAGKNVKLEKKYDSQTEKTRVNFNTSGLGFSKTIK